MGNEALPPLHAPLPPLHRHESRRGKTKRVVLYNLSAGIERSEIEDLCREYGAIAQLSKISKSTGSATVIMTEIESASRLFDGLHGVKVRNMPIGTRFGKTMKKNKIASELKKLSKTAKIKISGKAEGNKLNTKAKGKK